MVRAKVVTVICALCRMRQTMKRVNRMRLMLVHSETEESSGKDFNEY